MKMDEFAPVIASQEIEVEAKPDTIWNIIAAVDSWPNWNPDVKAAFIEGDLAAGTRFSWKAGQWTIRSTVSQMQRPSHLV